MSLSEIYNKFKPHLLMFMAQIVGSFHYFMIEASFNHGLNPHIYITYRHIVASIVLFPFAYFLERKQRPKLTLALFGQIFIVALFVVGMTLNMYFASMRYTSPTFVASVTNTVSALTFLIAILLRLEIVHLRNARSIAKVLGTLVSLAGVTIMTVYKGPIIRNLWNPLIHIHRNKDIHEQWVKGSALAVACCVTWAVAYILQATILKIYPARLSLTTWLSFLGSVQSAFFTVIIKHKPADWRIGFNIELLTILFSGIFFSGLYIFIQLWCTDKRGPVFVTVFSPFSAILVAIEAYFVFGEKLSLGSIMGAVIVIIGLYMLLWGKEGDLGVHITTGEQSYPTYDKTRELNVEKNTSTESSIPQGEP